MESLNLKVVAVLMPFEIKRHTIPHLKALTRSTLKYGIVVHVRLLIFGIFSHLYYLMSYCTFINFEHRLCILIENENLILLCYSFS